MLPYEFAMQSAKRVLDEPESEYIMTDDLTGELDMYIGKYMASVMYYGVDRTKQIGYIRRINTITKMMMERYDDVKIDTVVTPLNVKGKPDEQTPSVKGDRQKSDNHADCHDDTATTDITKNNR